MKGDNLLKASLLRNKIFYHQEIQFTSYIETINKEINSKITVHSKRKNTKIYSYKWVSMKL